MAWSPLFTLENLNKSSVAYDHIIMETIQTVWWLNHHGYSDWMRFDKCETNSANALPACDITNSG